MTGQAQGPASSSRAAVWCRVVHAAIAVVVVVSLAIQLALLFTGGVDANTGQAGEALPVGVRLWRMVSFFTIESNLLVLATAVVLTTRPRFDGRLWRVVRLDALLGIVITGLVYAIVLAPQLHLTGAALVATVGFHYVSPWLALAAWLVFGPRPRIRWSTVAAAFVWPVCWLAYIFTLGAFTHWYPYPFLDAGALGLTTAVRNALAVCLVAVVLAALFKLVDAKLPSPVRDDTPAEETFPAPSS